MRTPMLALGLAALFATSCRTPQSGSETASLQGGSGSGAAKTLSEDDSSALYNTLNGSAAKPFSNSGEVVYQFSQISCSTGVVLSCQGKNFDGETIILGQVVSRIFFPHLQMGAPQRVTNVTCTFVEEIPDHPETGKATCTYGGAAPSQPTPSPTPDPVPGTPGNTGGAWPTGSVTLNSDQSGLLLDDLKSNPAVSPVIDNGEDVYRLKKVTCTSGITVSCKALTLDAKTVFLGGAFAQVLFPQLGMGQPKTVKDFECREVEQIPSHPETKEPVCSFNR